MLPRAVHRPYGWKKEDPLRTTLFEVAIEALDFYKEIYF